MITIYTFRMDQATVYLKWSFSWWSHYITPHNHA